MKIWYISKYACPEKYNFGTRHFTFAKEFNSLGHETIVFTSNSNHVVSGLPQFSGLFKIEIIEGVKTVWINTPLYQGSKSFGRIWSWILFEIRLVRTVRQLGCRPDVVIASSLSLFTIISGAMLKKKYKAKLVFEVRDIWPLTLKYVSNLKPINPVYCLFSLIEKYGYNRSDLIVGSMPALNKHVENIINDSKKVCYIPHGIDLSKFEVEEPNFGEYGVLISDDDFVVSYSGTIGRVNTVEFLLRAAKNISLINDKIVFLIIGEGELKNEFKQECRNFNRIYFLPKVNKSKLIGILKKSDLLYYGARKCDLYNFGVSPNKLNDYLYASRPILSSFSGYDDLFESSGCGLIVEAENVSAIESGILYFYSMPRDLREKIGKSGHDYLINFRTSRFLANTYLNCIERS
jgi:glycosyltransferase involved in cell wall biosynthesis